MSNSKIASFLKTDPSLVPAVLCTAGYYSILLQPAFRETTLAKYTTEHAVEYVIVTLFFWGMIDIFFKLMSLPREFLATRHEWLPARAGREPVSVATEMLERVRQNPAWLLSSRIGRRIINALSFVAENNSAEDFRDHLQHLSDVEEQEFQTSYTLLRFVIAVTPILGFLGTVVHFGTAIGSFSFDNMDDKLPEIVGGMGTAFNTTSVALATAMTMMFAMFLCERVEQSIVAAIDRLTDLELMNRFAIKDPNIVPFLSLIQVANREALASQLDIMRSQSEVWAKGLDSMFQLFQERQQLESTHHQAAQDILRQRHEAFEASREDQMRQLFLRLDERHDQQLARLELALNRASEFRQDIGQLIDALNAIANGEGRLIELQSTLAENLRVLNETSQIDSALHGLTAAIHLITSRSRQVGLSESKAA